MPGRPDLVLKKYRTVIFVNGCFWHQHEDCRHGRVPRSNIDYWGPKLKKTVDRDRRNYRLLRAMGYETVIIWECELSGLSRFRENRVSFTIIRRLKTFPRDSFHNGGMVPSRLRLRAVTGYGNINWNVSHSVVSSWLRFKGLSVSRFES